MTNNIAKILTVIKVSKWITSRLTAGWRNDRRANRQVDVYSKYCKLTIKIIGCQKKQDEDKKLAGDRQTGRAERQQTYGQKVKQTDKKTGRETDTETDRHSGSKKDR